MHWNVRKVPSPRQPPHLLLSLRIAHWIWPVTQQVDWRRVSPLYVPFFMCLSSLFYIVAHHLRSFTSKTLPFSWPFPSIKNANGYRKKMSSFSARWLQQRRRIGDGWHNWKEPLGSSSSSETGNDNNLEYLCACRGSRSTATTGIRRVVRKQLQRGVLVRGTTCKESSTNSARKAGSKKREEKKNTVHTPVTLKHFISKARKESAAADDALLALWPHLLLVCNSIRNGGRSVGWWVGWGALPTDKGLLILDRLAPNVKWRCAAPCSAFSYILQQGLQHGFILFLLFFLLGRVYVCVSLCVCAKCVHRVCVCT